MAAATLGVDLATKYSSHPLILHHYRHATALDLAPMAIFLLCFALSSSNLVAAGAGLMFGGLCGNGGELLQHGYATDWILVGRFVTNVADLALLLGMLAVNVDLLWLRRRRTPAAPWSRGVGGPLALGCGVAAGAISGDLRVGEAVFFLVLIEAIVLEQVLRRRRFA